MEEDSSLGHLLPRYFLHGLLFSLILIILIFVWVFLTVALVFIGSILGLIIGIVLLFFIFGGINTYLMHGIWGISIKGNLLSLFTHGLVLFLVLLLVSIPSLIINLLAPNLAVSIVLFVFYCFVDGYVAKAVGGNWEEEQTDDGEMV
jgi:vacuolar-type H+-ATPase subunit I/STV1